MPPAFLVPVAMQAVVTPVGTLDRFDLAKVKRAAATCTTREAATDEILVCAPKAMSIEGLDGAMFAQGPLDPSVAVPLGGRGRVEAEQSDVGGVSVPSMMFKAKWPF